MPESRQPPWYADGLRFECTRCGRCCTGEGHVWIGPERIDEMAGFLGLTVEAFSRRYVRLVDGRLALVDSPRRADCVFWERDLGCVVYPVRPTQCRTFPFWREHLESPEAWRDLADEVPGIGRGRRHDEGEIRRRLRRSRRSGG